MNSFFVFCMVLAMLAVVATLALGLISMAKGGEFDRKYSNKFMQARVALQGLALLFLALAFLTSQS